MEVCSFGTVTPFNPGILIQLRTGVLLVGGVRYRNVWFHWLCLGLNGISRCVDVWLKCHSKAWMFIWVGGEVESEQCPLSLPFSSHLCPSCSSCLRPGGVSLFLKWPDFLVLEPDTTEPRYYISSSNKQAEWEIRAEPWALALLFCMHSGSLFTLIRILEWQWSYKIRNSSRVLHLSGMCVVLLSYPTPENLCTVHAGPSHIWIR